MTELTPQSLYTFQKRYQFRDGSLRQLNVRRVKGQTIGTLIIAVFDQQAKKKVRLKFTINHVEEYRFQRRPGTPNAKLVEVRFGFFGSLTYFNLDAYAEDGPPKVIDFRASDCFIAGQAIHWEEVPPKQA